MDELTFSETAYQTKKRKTHRPISLERMEKLTPLNQLKEKLAGHYSKAQAGRLPSTILRVHGVELLYNFSDRDTEDPGRQQAESRENQSQCSCQSRASIPVHCAGFWLWQGPLPGPCKEHQSTELLGCIEQPAHRRKLLPGVRPVRQFSTNMAGTVKNQEARGVFMPELRLNRFFNLKRDAT